MKLLPATESRLVRLSVWSVRTLLWKCLQKAKLKLEINNVTSAWSESSELFSSSDLHISIHSKHWRLFLKQFFTCLYNPFYLFSPYRNLLWHVATNTKIRKCIFSQFVTLIFTTRFLYINSSTRIFTNILGSFYNIA